MIAIKIIFWIAAWHIVYAYVLYPLFLYLFRNVGPRRDLETTDELPGVSIVIAAYNEEKHIKSRIENCLALDYPPDRLEIIIASDGSEDKTAQIVSEYESKGVRFFDYKERSGKVNVLNKTVPQAKNEIIVFSDANAMFEREAIKRLVKHFGNPKIGSVCGRLQFINEGGGHAGDLEGIYWQYETMLKKLEGRRGALLGANGAIYAVRKELFPQCPEDTLIEDFLVPMKILENGYYVVYEPEAMAFEETAQKVIQEKHRRIRIGAGGYQSLFRLYHLLNPFRGFSAVAFLSHKVYRWFAPFFLMVAFVSNFLLVKETFYMVLYSLQCIFYLCALAGQYLSHKHIKNRFLNLCYYFCSMNLALLLGFVRYVNGSQKVTWKRTER